ncbi:MAG: gas vesicle protein [Nanoarchaeota archaeon]|nr:gas vesicle protein [Nanoarchaeota archaeon]
MDKYSPKLKLVPKQREGLIQTVDRMLDKGIVIDVKLRLYLKDLKLIGVRATTILTNFESGIKFGLDFPEDTNFDTKAWRDLIIKEKCHQCSKMLKKEELNDGCPWCGFNLKTS